VSCAPLTLLRAPPLCRYATLPSYSIEGTNASCKICPKTSAFQMSTACTFGWGGMAVIGATIVAGIAAHIGTKVTPRKTQTKYRWYSTMRKKRKPSEEAQRAAAAAEAARRHNRDADASDAESARSSGIVHTGERVVAPPPDIVTRTSERESREQEMLPMRTGSLQPTTSGNDQFVNVVDVRRASSEGDASSRGAGSGGVFIRPMSQDDNDPYANHLYSEIVTVPPPLPPPAGTNPAVSVEETSFSAPPSTGRSSGQPTPSAPPASSSAFASSAAADAAAAGEPPVKQRLTLSDGDDLHEVSETDLLHLGGNYVASPEVEDDDEGEVPEAQPLMRGASLTGALAVVSEVEPLDDSLAPMRSSMDLTPSLAGRESASLLSPRRTSTAGAASPATPSTPRQSQAGDHIARRADEV
jgi:hypothetical protein